MKTPSYYARSIRYAGLVTLIATASAVQACSNDTIPTAPSSVASLSAIRPTPTVPTESRVFGTVTDDEGMPVAGVTVTVYRWDNGARPTPTVTDSRGFYSVSFVSALYGGISALTEKQGYERAWHNRSTGASAAFDLRIHRVGQ